MRRDLRTIQEERGSRRLPNFHENPTKSEFHLTTCVGNEASTSGWTVNRRIVGVAAPGE
jgi:hypothetical protein